MNFFERLRENVEYVDLHVIAAELGITEVSLYHHIRVLKLFPEPAKRRSNKAFLWNAEQILQYAENLRKVGLLNYAAKMERLVEKMRIAQKKVAEAEAEYREREKELPPIPDYIIIRVRREKFYRKRTRRQK